jgi:hypothetical protein
VNSLFRTKKSENVVKHAKGNDLMPILLEVVNRIFCKMDERLQCYFVKLFCVIFVQFHPKLLLEFSYQMDERLQFYFCPFVFIGLN